MAKFGSISILEQIFCIIFITIVLAKCYGNFIDYAENTELIQQKVGYDVKLQCNLKGLVDEHKLADAKIHWFFKQCGDQLPHTSNCHDFYEDDWTELPCERSLCQSELLLRNVTERYSGLYKCTVYPYRPDVSGQALDIQLVRTYQLEVKNSTLGVPEFLDQYPQNATVAMGAQVVLPCRVHSDVHLTIKWFRRKLLPHHGGEYTINNNNFNAHRVFYNGHTYELLSKAREKFISDEIYFSQLILNDLRKQDEGYYACVAINYHGHSIREAYLEVYVDEEAEEEYWTDYDDDTNEVVRTNPMEFWLLFLMPLGLALLPLSVWFGYIIYRRCRAIRAEKQKAGGRAAEYFEEELTPDRCMLKV